MFIVMISNNKEAFLLSVMEHDVDLSIVIYLFYKHCINLLVYTVRRHTSSSIIIMI